MSSATGIHFQFVILDEIFERGSNSLFDALGNPLGYLFDRQSLFSLLRYDPNLVLQIHGRLHLQASTGGML